MRQCTRWNFGRASRGYVRFARTITRIAAGENSSRARLTRLSSYSFATLVELLELLLLYYYEHYDERDERSIDRKLLLEMLMSIHDLKYIVTILMTGREGTYFNRVYLFLLSSLRLQS